MKTSELIEEFLTKYEGLWLGDYLGLPPSAQELDDVEVCVLPAPYDATTTARSGTRLGPHALLTASQEIEVFDLLNERITSSIKLMTLPTLPPMAAGPLEMVDRVREAHARLLELGKRVVMIGGEHSLTIGAIEAHRRIYPDLVYISLDAHGDLRESYQGSRFSHACVTRRASEGGPALVFGARSMSTAEWEFATQATHVTVVTSRALKAKSYPASVLGLFAGKHVYLSIDLDVLDPSIMPAVGTPEPGGLFWDETLDLCETIQRNSTIVGLDIVELAPIAGLDHPNYLAARLLQVLLGRWIPNTEPPAAFKQITVEQVEPNAGREN